MRKLLFLPSQQLISLFPKEDTLPFVYLILLFYIIKQLTLILLHWKSCMECEPLEEYQRYTSVLSNKNLFHESFQLQNENCWYLCKTCCSCRSSLFLKLYFLWKSLQKYAWKLSLLNNEVWIQSNKFCKEENLSLYLDLFPSPKSLYITSILVPFELKFPSFYDHPDWFFHFLLSVYEWAFPNLLCWAIW